MTAPVNVRWARSEDVDDLIALRTELFRSAPPGAHWAGQSNLAWIEGYRSFLREEFSSSRSRQATAVAVDRAGHAVGSATGMIDERLPGPTNTNGVAGWVQGVFVEDKARGQGVAQQLMRQLESWFADKGVSAVRLDTTAMAFGMYARLGYAAHEELHMVKSL